MNDLDERVRRAFDEVTVPDEVKRRALASIACKAASFERAAAPDAQPAVGDPAAKRPRGRMIPFRRAAIALAACLALAAVGFGGFAAYAQPTAYVGIDVNPSLELGVNRFGIVVEAEALNDDGRALLEAVALTGRSYAEALSELTGSEAFAPYAQEDSFVEISVTSSDDRQAEDIRKQSTACLEALPCRGTCHAVDGPTREAAAAAGMGVGRYRAALELMQLDPDVTLEECATLSMRELRDRIASLSSDGDAQDDVSSGHGSNGSRGQGGGEGGGRGRQHQGGGGHGNGPRSEGPGENG